MFNVSCLMKAKHLRLFKNKISAMTELIALSLQKHTLLEFTKRSNLKLLGHSPLCCIMSVLLEHMNILVASEENFEISSKRYQETKCHRQKNRKREDEKKFSPQE